MTERSRRVVLLIDYDNLQICAARDTPGRELQLTPVVQLAQRYGTVILARAYAEWNLSTERLAVYKAGIEPAFAPVLRTESDRSGKSLADTVMVAEGMDMLWTLSPEVVVLATSDKDLIPLVRVAKQRGAFVVVLGSDFTAIPLREMADEHVTYRQLISDAGGRGATEAGPGRQPAALPEPARRRRDRNGRERTQTATPAPSTAPATSATSAAPAASGGQSRPEREPAPAPAPTGGAPTEPVAPLTSGAPGDADTQISGRRRRRRGSRRRSDRLGTSEANVGGEGGDAATDETGFEESLAETLGNGVAEVTPTTSAADVARASDAIVEAEAHTETEPAAEPAAVEPEAPRERRRRTRRRVPAEAAAEAEAGPEIVPPAAEALAPSAEIMPAPPPEAASANGAEEAAPKPTRARRVASASRGRSRRA